MSERDAFLHAIRDRPGEDAPRLVFADWLDEHGEPDRAEFIRVQVELSRALANAAAYEGGTDALRRHDSELLRAKRSPRAASNARRWFDGPWWRANWPDCDVREGGRCVVDGTVPGFMDDPGWPMAFQFRRGFVAAVTMPTGLFLDHGPSVVMRHPVESVALAGKEPTRGLGHGWDADWIWYGGDDGDTPHGLPTPIWRAYVGLTAKLPGRGRHPTRKDALHWLSEACIAWATAEAGRRAGTAGPS